MDTLPRSVLTWALAAIAGLLSACASAPPATGWHTLVPQPGLVSPTVMAPSPGNMPGSTEARPRAWSLGAVSLPAEVDRPQLVLRFGVDGVLLAEDERWIEPLKQQLPRALVLALSERSGRPVLQALGSGTASHRLTVEVQRFELRPDESAVLRAVWALTPVGNAGAATPALVRVFEVSVPATAGVAGSVEAMRQAVDRLASEIAASVDRSA